MTATVYRVEELHISTSPDLPVIRRDHQVTTRFVTVPRQCFDCDGTPETIPPDEGYHAAFVMVHSGTCPLFRAAALRQEGGDAA